jgi:hypothetical protein
VRTLFLSSEVILPKVPFWNYTATRWAMHSTLERKTFSSSALEMQLLQD